MNGLVESGVVLTRSTHTYRIGGKELSGITGMIGRQLFPGKYRNVPNFIADDAKSLGEFIHKVMEYTCKSDDEYEEQEICYGEEKGKPTLNPIKRAYLKLVEDQNIRTVASEYIVTDGVRFASPIDKVFSTPSGGYVLADIKTGSHIDTDYARWQLSVYRLLFLMQNPQAKVERLSVIHVCDYGRMEMVDVEPVPEDCVRGLMQAEAAGMKYDCPPAQRPVGRMVPMKYLEMEYFYLSVKHHYEKVKETYERMLECVGRDMYEEATDVIVTPRMVFRRDPETGEVAMAEPHR